jgi:hypothetical protein
MKYTVALLAIALQVTGVLSASADMAVAEAAAEAHGVAVAELIAECGDLGIMAVPEGANAGDYRKCLDHPEGTDRALSDPASSIAPLDNDIVVPGPDSRQLKGSEIFGREAMKCEYSAGLGCSRNGFCWKACGTAGDGKWCWTAGGIGFGDWLKCTTYADCSTWAACGQGCAECGCGC